MNELLRGILEHPHEDARRLVYADWLDEHGEQKRAAFIRWGFGDTLRGMGRFTYRKWGFPWWIGQSVYRSVWRQGPCADIYMVGWRRQGLSHPQHCYVAKGFVAGIYLPLDVFLLKAEGIFRSQPVTFTKLLDREPWGGGDTGDNWMWWFDFGDTARVAPGSCQLPRCLIGFLNLAHKTRQGALDALSLACCNYGRSLTGLPALPG